MIRRLTVLLTAVVAAIVLVSGMALSQTLSINPTYSIKNLGTLGGNVSENGSVAWGINDSGQVVGFSTITSTGETHAFLYLDGEMHDLNDLIPADSGWELDDAYAINNSGQIVGSGRLNGEARAFLATPATTTIDTKPPKVISTSPKANATEVAPTANVRATFSEEMDSETINGTTFTLFEKGTTTQIPATVSYNADTDTVKLDPTNNLRKRGSLQGSGDYLGRGCCWQPSRPGRLHQRLTANAVVLQSGRLERSGGLVSSSAKGRSVATLALSLALIHRSA
jgi:probable HAF family extracellular repeat protein